MIAQGDCCYHRSILAIRGLRAVARAAAGWRQRHGTQSGANPSAPNQHHRGGGEVEGAPFGLKFRVGVTPLLLGNNEINEYLVEKIESFILTKLTWWDPSFVTSGKQELEDVDPPKKTLLIPHTASHR